MGNSCLCFPSRHMSLPSVYDESHATYPYCQWSPVTSPWSTASHQHHKRHHGQPIAMVYPTCTYACIEKSANPSSTASRHQVVWLSFWDRTYGRSDHSSSIVPRVANCHTSLYRSTISHSRKPRIQSFFTSAHCCCDCKLNLNHSSTLIYYARNRPLKYQNHLNFASLLCRLQAKPSCHYLPL